jgi:hypothetical protein
MPNVQADLEHSGVRVDHEEPSPKRPATQQGLAADNRQLGVRELGSILALGLRRRGADGQRCLLQLKPHPLDGAILAHPDRNVPYDR